jgi:hypothetical protein
MLGPVVVHSGRQIVKLGERLRSSPVPAIDDLKMLGEVLLEYDRVMMIVAADLRGIGLEATTRLKTSGTIIEKLCRESHLNLRSIRDLAGARIVKRMMLDEQDAIASQIRGLWADTKFIDRRADPSHGYRAIHVVARIDGCQVEIQLRTEYQDLWAQTMETFGDAWGRAIRYGGEPDDPDAIVGSGPLSRREFVKLWKGQADALYELAQLENDAYRLRAEPTTAEITDRLAVISTEMDSRFASVKFLVEELRSVFG